MEDLVGDEEEEAMGPGPAELAPTAEAEVII